MKYVKNDIVQGKNGVDYVITRVDKVRNNYRAVPLMQYQFGLGDMFGCIVEEQNIVKLSGRNTKYGIILGGATC